LASDGSLMVAANNSGMVYVWELGKSQTAGDDDVEARPFQKTHAHKTYVLRCLLSPNNKLMATTSADTTVKLWSVPEFKLERTLTGHQRWVWDAIFSSDSAYLITASSDQSARLWDVNQAETIRHYHGHHKGVICAALSDASATDAPPGV